MNTQARECRLSPATLAAIRLILESEPTVERAILFGSRAKGTHRRGSDIDLALLGEHMDFEVLGRLTRAFEDSSIPEQVDLCWLDAVDSPALREHIARVGRLLYMREASHPGSDGARHLVPSVTPSGDS